MGRGDRAIAKVLIVDDLEVNRLLLEEIVRDMGYCPILAESGEEALRAVRDLEPQLVLSDISMPGMDGYELCRILKSSEKTRDIPVIFISAFDQAEDVVHGLGLGGEDYITKPFVPRIVQARVGVHLSLYQARRELKESNRKLQASVQEQQRQLEQEKKEVLYALAAIAAENSCYEKGHIERLRTNCGILAQAMQLSPRFEGQISDSYINTMELAAPLCDIGNIGVPWELLKKREALEEGEMALVRKHTSIGAKLLADLHVGKDYNDFLKMAEDIAHYHHENWDGTGYPDGLTGEQIPLSAQIVSIVGAYCALTEKKHYTREEAMGILEGEAGTKFNPEIFKICAKISRRFR